MTTGDRLKSHLLRRIRRHSLRMVFSRACSAGLLVPEDITVGPVNVRRYRNGPIAGIATGPRGDEIVRRRLAPFQATSTEVSPDLHAEVVNAFIEGGFDSNIAGEFLSQEGDPTIPMGANKEHSKRASSSVPLLSAPLLDHLKRSALPLPVMEVAVAILLAEAFRKSGCSGATLLTILRSPSPLVCLRIPTREAEAVVCQMLKQGMLLTHPVKTQDGLGNYSFSERWPQEEAASITRTVVSYRLTQLEALSQERLRQTMARATRSGAPVLILTESRMPWPIRAVSSADVILDGPSLDNRMLAEIIEVCLGTSQEATLSGLSTRDVRLGYLGLDDLALAIRRDLPFDTVLDRLERLSLENVAIDGDDEKEEDVSSKQQKEEKEDKVQNNTTSKSEGSRERKSGKQHHVELILPQTIRRKRGMQPPLLVESLSGYGEARSWAIDLKADLKLWKRKKIHWSDMSTKLLLSGPPGTGKSTFARALCNTMGIPLIATSVGEWLEPGYLGDVLRRMTSVFEAAQARQPVIMLIDEIDGIGRRDAGGGRSYDDYWISVINRLLELLDGVVKSEGVIIIGATNRPDVIDPALRRSGRLETHIPIQPPDLDALEGILAHHLGPDLKRVIANAAQAKALPTNTREPAHG
ncbi:AAA family ATPase [Pseudorhizobium flavum]|uniref:AAA family ATPase n=1 Tax=Pseudorhizobium flavum TaxID=1335061 RepID=UPI0024917BB0|nr:ATP-binding protein [Pseudorhizobium flavum]